MSKSYAAYVQDCVQVPKGEWEGLKEAAKQMAAALEQDVICLDMNCPRCIPIRAALAKYRELDEARR